MNVLEQAEQVVVGLARETMRSAEICGCQSCKARARDFLAWFIEEAPPVATRAITVVESDEELAATEARASETAGDDEEVSTS